jgi:hypothetical protein
LVDFTFGFTLKLEKTKRPFAVANVYYDKGSHMIEFRDPEDATKVIKGLIPPYPESAQTPSEPHESKKEDHGIG